MPPSAQCGVFSAIGYPLTVTSFTRDQCLCLQKTYTGTFLSHMVIASTTSRVLIFGSSYYSGFKNLPELWVSQGTTHLTFLLGHLNAEDNFGFLIRISLDTLQLHLGFPLPPLTYSYSSIAQYTTTTWDFMTETSALLTHSDPWIPPFDRQNADCHLMPRLISLAPTFSITAPDIIKFNICRQYLQVLTLSDIVESTDNTIDMDFCNGSKNDRVSNLSWPKQTLPGSTSRTIWRHILSRLFAIKSRSLHLCPQSCLLK